ncbi:TonB-dependent receptor [Pacificimonas sp. WHA3]|uniref:TonB-dependent receptor n=1 Tax=Pacificimonas pallii TaxID=2827236 RepID=A0ABS6SFG2_9SPHN|nr:TonB-dependent receptor [Pacificimonas pallii]MBV7257137.1 TonB-dependent receptor [Pacificimonas pallii]
MKKISTRTTYALNGLAAICLAAAGAGAVAAQDSAAASGEADALPGSTDDEIVVTASRRREKLQDAPLAISVIDSEEFVKSGLTSLDTILNYTPGAQLVGSGTPGEGTVILRAISQESLIPVTAIYVDDVALTSATPYADAGEYFLDGLLGDLERVEIIKGPQGTLYGASAMGGVVRYTTRDPALDHVRGSVSADVSTLKRGAVSQFYRGTVSAPVVQDKIGVTLNGFWQDQRGFIDRLDPVTLAVAEKDYNASERFGVNAAVLLQMTDRARLKVTGTHQKTRIRGGAGIELIAPSADDLDFTIVNGRYQFAAADPGRTTIRQSKLDGVFKYEFDWAELTSVTAYSKADRDSQYDQANEPGIAEFVDFLLGSPAGTTQSVPTVAFTQSERFSQELRLVSNSGGKLDWIVGAFFVAEDTSNITSTAAEPQDALLISARLPGQYRESAVYGDLTYYITPDFDVTGGVRYSDSSYEADFNFGGLFLDPVDDRFGTDAQVFTYLLNARWRPSTDLSLYARAASGYRPGYVNIPLTDPVTGRSSSDFVKADSLWSYEVGAKGSLLDGGLKYDLALWYVDWTDFQAEAIINAVGTTTNSDVDMTSHGFELSLNSSLTDRLSIAASLAYAQGELDGDSAELGGLKGERTRFIPKWTASARANYAYQLANLDGLATLGARYVGNYTTVYRGGFSDSLMQQVGFGEFQFPIEDYALVDLSSSLTKGNLTFTVYATNVLDKFAFTSGSTLDTEEGPIAGFGNVAEPRRIGASVAISF